MAAQLGTDTTVIDGILLISNAAAMVSLIVVVGIAFSSRQISFCPRPGDESGDVTAGLV